jgi:two-component system response regulator LytT
MLTILMFDQDKQENQMLVKHSKDAIAFYSDDSLDVIEVMDKQQVKEFLQKKQLMDAAFLDVTNQDGILLSKKIREAYELSELLVIADASVSPMKYMTPDIRAASLLLRPFSKEQSRQVIEQFFRSFYRNQLEEKEERILVVENRQGKINIPYSQIYYLEVREKKVFIRLKEREYSKYETMENMMKILPSNFIRCHRSFAVNKNYITRVKLSENTIYLENQITVPLSRSYKAEIKEHINQLRKKGAE